MKLLEALLRMLLAIAVGKDTKSGWECMHEVTGELPTGLEGDLRPKIKLRVRQ